VFKEEVAKTLLKFLDHVKMLSSSWFIIEKGKVGAKVYR